MPLPEQIEPTVAPTGIQGGTLQTYVRPEQIGGQVARGLQEAGAATGDIAHRQRLLNADFQAVEADHEFVKRETDEWEKFKTKYKPNELKDHLPEYQASLESLGQKVLQDMGIKDPLAQKAYLTMTRRRQDFRMAHAIEYAGDQNEKWMDNEAQGSVDKAALNAQTRPPPMRADGSFDTRDLGLDLSEMAHLYGTRLEQHMPADKAAEKVHEAQIKVIESALGGFVGNDQVREGKAFLDAPIAGVTDAQGVQLTPRRILGARALTWENKLKERHAEKVGDVLGLAVMQATGMNSLKAEQELQRRAALPEDNPDHIDAQTLKQAVDSVAHYGQVHKDVEAQTIADAEKTVYRAIHNNGDSLVGAFKTKEELEAWDLLKDTNFKERLRNELRKDENPDGIAMARFTEYLVNNTEEASKMSVAQLEKKARELGATQSQMTHIGARIEHFISQKDPERRRQAATQAMQAHADLFESLGKPYDAAHPEQNKWSNWSDPLERKAAALWEQKFFEWQGKWEREHKGAAPPDEEYEKFKASLLQRVPAPPGTFHWRVWETPTEPRILQMARQSLAAPSGKTQDIQVKPQAAPAAPSLSYREQVRSRLESQGVQPTDAAIDYYISKHPEPTK